VSFKGADPQGKGAASGWGEHLQRRSPSGLGSARQPGPILYTPWVNKMSVVRMSALALAPLPTRPRTPFLDAFLRHFRAISAGFCATPEVVLSPG
jgi:hypothetical protein